MKTLILYATKYGAAREIAERLASVLQDAAIHDIKSENLPPLSQFERVIIGSSVYAGRLRKEAVSFVKQNAEELSGKTLGLYVSGMASGEDKARDYLKANFPENVVNNAKAVDMLGGVADPSKSGFFDRLVLRIASKQSGYLNTINDENIKAFIDKLTQ